MKKKFQEKKCDPNKLVENDQTTGCFKFRDITFVACSQIYASWSHLGTEIILVPLYYLKLERKLHKDLSSCCRYNCNIVLMFLNNRFSIYLP